MRGLKLLTLLGIGAVLWSGPSAVVYGQTDGHKDSPPPLATFSLNIKDGTVRAALTGLFEAAHVQYSIDQKVTGFETLHITDQTFDSALKVLIRSSSQPLACSMEGGVYYIFVREVIPATPPGVTTILSGNGEPPELHSSVEVLTLNHADPYDLSSLLGIKIVPFGTRFTGAASGGAAGSGSAGGPGGAGAPKGNSGPASGTNGSSVINTGMLISSDVNNDILHIGD